MWQPAFWVQMKRTRGWQSSERTYSQVNTYMNAKAYVRLGLVSPSQFEQLLASPQVRAEKVCCRGRLMLRTATMGEIKDLSAPEAWGSDSSLVGRIPMGF